MILSISKKVPGQPWVMTSGVGLGPFPFSWMKWMPRPSTSVLKWEKELIRFSWPRQSNLVRQYSTNSLT